jgi:hypothetical protein
MMKMLLAAAAAFALTTVAPAFAAPCKDCPEHKAAAAGGKDCPQHQMAAADKAEKKEGEKTACKCAADTKGECKCAGGKCECPHCHGGKKEEPKKT